MLMCRSVRLISILLCNAPKDDGDWWMDKHQVTHVTVSVHMSTKAVHRSYGLYSYSVKVDGFESDHMMWFVRSGMSWNKTPDRSVTVLPGLRASLWVYYSCLVPRCRACVFENSSGWNPRHILPPKWQHSEKQKPSQPSVCLCQQTFKAGQLWVNTTKSVHKVTQHAHIHTHTCTYASMFIIE